MMTSNHKALFLVACGAFIFVTAARSQVSRIDSTLQAIQALFETGSYVNSEIEARRLLDLPMLNDSVRVLAEKWIAFSLVAQGKTGAAKSHFVICLRIDPQFDLDPILTSPKIMAVFNEAKSEMPVGPLKRGDDGFGRRQTAPTGATFRAVLFPGWEQLHRGDLTKGYLFVAGGIGTLGAGIVFETLRASARKEYLAATFPGDIESKYGRYNQYRKAEIISFSAFAVLYIVSQLDVFLFSDEVSVESNLASFPHSNPTVSFHIRF